MGEPHPQEGADRGSRGTWGNPIPRKEQTEEAGGHGGTPSSGRGREKELRTWGPNTCTQVRPKAALTGWKPQFCPLLSRQQNEG